MRQPTTTAGPERPVSRYGPIGTAAEADGAHEIWESRTRVALTPIAAPSILGLFGFSAATLIVAANLAGWYGTPHSGAYLFPFAAFFGGLAQFVAGLWAYRARDGLATAMHGMWGSFWMAWGLLQVLYVTGTLVDPGVNNPEFGFWFIALAAITLMGTFAALRESVALTAVLATLTAGSAFLAVAFLDASLGWQHVGGWVLVFSAGFAWYTAGAMMLEGTYRRVVLPLGKYSAHQNVPGAVALRPLEFHDGMPGVRAGQ